MGKFRIKYTRNETKNILLARIEDIEDALTPEDALKKLMIDKENKYPFIKEDTKIVEIEKIE